MIVKIPVKVNLAVICKVLSIILCLSACKKEKKDPQVASAPSTQPTEIKPSLITLGVTGLAYNSAISGGFIVDQGTSPVIAAGICWNTSPDPTISNYFTVSSSVTGTFASTMTDLKANTLYYLRSYATTSLGTTYDANAVIFRTPKNWALLTQAPTGKINSMASSGSSLFAATITNGVFYSIDNGDTWTHINLVNNNVKSVVSLGTTVYAGTYGQGVFRADQYGSDWTQINTGLDDHNVTNLVVLNQALFAVASGNLYKKSETDDSWSKLSLSIEVGNIWGSDAGILLIDKPTNKIYSLNEDSSISFVTDSPDASPIVIKDLYDRIYLGTNTGAYELETGSTQWQKVTDSFLNNKIVSDFTLGYQSLYAASANNVFVSSGTQWLKANEGMPEDNSVITLLFHYQGTLFAASVNGSSNKLYKMVQ